MTDSINIVTDLQWLKESVAQSSDTEAGEQIHTQMEVKIPFET